MINDDASKNQKNVSDSSLSDIQSNPIGEHPHQKEPEWFSKLWQKVWHWVVADTKKIKFENILRLVEVVLLGGVVYIYSRQLYVMEGQLREIEGSSQQTNMLIITTAHQVSNMHELVVATGNQATAAKNQVTKLEAGVQQTTILAGAAKTSNEISKQAMETQTRPWVGISDVTFVVEPGKENSWRSIVSASMTSTVRNYGATPAHKVGIYFEAFEAIKAYGQWPYITRPMCEKAEQEGGRDIPMHPSYPESIFPDAKGVKISDSVSVRKGTQWPDTNILGCIAYQSTFNESWHHTRFMYGLPSISGITTTGPGQPILSNTD
jgi:hypothetical protein